MADDSIRSEYPYDEVDRAPDRRPAGGDGRNERPGEHRAQEHVGDVVVVHVGFAASGRGS